VAGLADSRADDPAAGGGKNVDGPGEVLAERAGLKLKGLGGLAQDPSAGLDICGGHGFGSAGA
jgi:hypothetical protein